jgi:hypothetical protein
MYNCKYCDRLLSNKGSKGSHEPFCKLNPERKKRNRSPLAGAKKGSIPWNKGGKTTEEVKMKIKKAVLGKSSGRASTPEAEIERKEKISASMKSHPNGGGLREGSGRGVKTWYESVIAGKVYLRSTYELRYVKVLDSLGIKWKQNHQGFDYIWEGNSHKYYPDFYLEDEDCFVEVKGFKTLKDEAKWKQFPFKLKIVYEQQIKEMEE